MATGILGSRLLGLVRERLFAFYFGHSDAGDAFRAALRIPNILQNLLGEGILSASFIPVYARLDAQGNHAEADRLARAMFWFLAAAVSMIVAAGILLAPALATFFAPGFEGEKRELTVQLLRIVFPGTGFLVFSGWCLGVLNSHHRFLLSYSAPIAWNLVLIAVLLIWGRAGTSLPDLAISLSWGFVVGSFVQCLVQLPAVFRYVDGLGWPSWFRGQKPHEAMNKVLRGFASVLLGRGVVQISAYVDTMVASWLAPGSLSILVYAQTLAQLPLSLFGMSVSAAELPLLSRELASGSPGEQAALLRAKLESARDRVLFFIAPTCLGFALLGPALLSVLYRGGAFGALELVRTIPVLTAFAAWLPASTLGRLYSSALFAAEDTRTPARWATIRVVLGLSLSLLVVEAYRDNLLPPGIEPVAFVVAVAAIAGQIEAWGLRRKVESRFGRLRPLAQRPWLAAGLAVIPPLVLGEFLPREPWLLRAGLQLSVFAASYGIAALLLGLPEALGLRKKIRDRFGKAS